MNVKTVIRKTDKFLMQNVQQTFTLEQILEGLGIALTGKTVPKRLEFAQKYSDHAKDPFSDIVRICDFKKQKEHVIPGYRYDAACAKYLRNNKLSIENQGGIIVKKGCNSYDCKKDCYSHEECPMQKNTDVLFVAERTENTYLSLHKNLAEHQIRTEFLTFDGLAREFKTSDKLNRIKEQFQSSNPVYYEPKIIIYAIDPMDLNSIRYSDVIVFDQNPSAEHTRTAFKLGAVDCMSSIEQITSYITKKLLKSQKYEWLKDGI